VTGVVLAGGGARRFGADKLGADLDGLPLLHHAILRVAEVALETVVVTAAEGPEPALPLGVPARIARDAVAGEGPLHGAAVGLAAASTDLALVVGGDMPALSVAVLSEMARVARDAPVDGVVLADATAREGWRPLPAVVAVERSGTVARTLLHEGERSLVRWLQALRLAVIDEPTWQRLDPARGSFVDVDTPADLPLGGSPG
jgi:molybdopterin-guanine dinucleotide biosynthesis protein A